MSDVMLDWVRPAMIRDFSTDLSTTPLEHQALVFTRGVTLVVGRPRNDHRPVVSLSLRFEDDAVADGPATRARQVAGRVARRAAAAALREVEAARDQPAARAAAEARQVVANAEAELAAVERELADLRQKHRVTLEAGENPSVLAEKTLVCERRLASTKEWAEKLKAKHKAAIAAVPIVRTDDHWRGQAAAALRDIDARRAALRAKSEAAAEEFAIELIELYHLDRLLRGSMPVPAPPEPPADTPAAPVVAPDAPVEPTATAAPAAPDRPADPEPAAAEPAAETVTA